MIIACTGSRPPKLGGYSLPNPIYNKICQQTHQLLINLQPSLCLTGMAIGYDQYFANICLKLNIPFSAIIPFPGQEQMWPKQSQNTYHYLLNKAKEVITVSPAPFSKEKMQLRNIYLVDHSDQLIACFDGQPSGTKNCVDYAKSISKIIHHIVP